MATTTDFEQDYGVDPKRAVLVQGICDDDTNEEITEVLGTFGEVAKIVRLTPLGAIIEFDSEEAVTDLKPQFPFEVATARDSTVKWCLDSIDKVTPRTSQPSPPAKADLSEPRQDKTGSNESSSSDPGEVESDSSEISCTSLPPKKRHTIPVAPQSTSPASVKAAKPKRRAVPVTPAALDNDVLNPQDVQRIIVEHVIKNEASTPSLGSKQLQSFSGRVPKPPGEVDFETWCLHVELMFQDGMPTDIQRRMILESLLSPAADSPTTRVQFFCTRLCKTSSISIWTCW